MVRYALIGLIAVVTLGYQAAVVTSIVAGWQDDRGIPEAPFDLRRASTVIRTVDSGAVAAGLRSGDQVLEIGGVRLTGRFALERALADVHPGQRLPIRWQRDGQELRGEIEVRFRTVPRSAIIFLLDLVTQFLTPGLCLVVGLSVVAIRPRDPNAWLLLFLLWTFSLLGAGGIPLWRRVPEWLGRFAVVYEPIGASLWGLAMALFGLNFPQRLKAETRVPWLRTALTALYLAGAFLAAIGAHRFYNDNQFAPWLDFAGNPFTRSFWLNAVGVSVFFTSFGVRSGWEQDPDARRRLKLIYWGLGVSLMPMFLILLAGQILGGDPYRRLPPFLVIPALLLHFLFPLTLAYVIVVHRAMDVRVVVRQGLQYALARRGAIAVRVLLMMATMWWVYEVVSDPESRRPARFQAIAVSMVVAVWSGRLLQQLQSWIDRRFFREAIQTERVLAELSDSVRTYVETEPLLKRVADVVRETLHLEHVAMLLSGGPSPAVAYATGYTQPPTPDRLDAALILPLSAKDRIVGHMALGPKRNEEPFSSSDLQLLSTVADQAALALENSKLAAAIAQEVAQRERLNRELEIAREVQQRLFPQSRPQVAGLVYAGHCRPAQSVGGDYFDFLEIPGGVGLAIGDVSGKGVPASLLMASLQASLRAQVMAGAQSLAKIIANINGLIFDASPVNRYATFFYAQYDADSRHLTYVNAGHNAPLILRGSEVIRLEDGGPVVGLFRQAVYRQGTIELQPGDVLVGFTDGVSEAMNSSEEEWGEDALIQTVVQCALLPPEKIMEALLREADRFSAGAPQHDDMTLVVATVQ